MGSLMENVIICFKQLWHVKLPSIRLAARLALWRASINESYTEIFIESQTGLLSSTAMKIGSLKIVFMFILCTFHGNINRL